MQHTGTRQIPDSSDNTSGDSSVHVESINSVRRWGFTMPIMYISPYMFERWNLINMENSNTYNYATPRDAQNDLAWDVHISIFIPHLTLCKYV